MQGDSLKWLSNKIPHPTLRIHDNHPGKDSEMKILKRLVLYRWEHVEYALRLERIDRYLECRGQTIVPCANPVQNSPSIWTDYFLNSNFQKNWRGGYSLIQVILQRYMGTMLHSVFWVRALLDFFLNTVWHSIELGSFVKAAASSPPTFPSSSPPAPTSNLQTTLRKLSPPYSTPTISANISVQDGDLEERWDGHLQCLQPHCKRLEHSLVCSRVLDCTRCRVKPLLLSWVVFMSNLWGVFFPYNIVLLIILLLGCLRRTSSLPHTYPSPSNCWPTWYSFTSSIPSRRTSSI